MERRRYLLGNSTDDCPIDMSGLNFALGNLVLFGTVISALPQLLKIHHERTHIGLSYANFLAASVVGDLLFISYVILEYDSTFPCCYLSGVSAYGCIASWLVFTQLLLAALCSNSIVFLYFYHYDHDAATQEELKRGAIIGSGFKRDKRLLYAYFAGMSLVYLLAFSSMRALGLDHKFTHDYGEGLGIFTGCLISVHWLPQLWTSWKLGHPGSLSVTMLILQSSGSVVAAYNEYQHGPADWDVWGPYLVVATMMYTLLFELIYLVKCTERGRPYTLFDCWWCKPQQPTYVSLNEESRNNLEAL
eukprot:gb/GEZN01006834.1/.p1 GENE.gb/GEZN01006834.1/~~gb/GEZN01006834.1/.p1  ORF type:complete len:303 (-),score=24.98 gb/GEZN01006834.1/:626-1534(-)